MAPRSTPVRWTRPITLDRIEADEGPNRDGDGADFTNNGNPTLPTNRGNFLRVHHRPPNWLRAQLHQFEKSRSRGLSVT